MDLSWRYVRGKSPKSWKVRNLTSPSLQQVCIMKLSRRCTILDGFSLDPAQFPYLFKPFPNVFLLVFHDFNPKSPFSLQNSHFSPLISQFQTNWWCTLILWVVPSFLLHFIIKGMCSSHFFLRIPWVVVSSVAMDINSWNYSSPHGNLLFNLERGVDFCALNLGLLLKLGMRCGGLEMLGWISKHI